MSEKKAYDILVYIHEPSGYGHWSSPEYFASELAPETEKYIVNGEEQKGKQVYVLTDFYTPAHNMEKARLYVPKGTTAQESGLKLIPLLRVVA